jgi:hypothetical protein
LRIEIDQGGTEQASGGGGASIVSSSSCNTLSIACYTSAESGGANRRCFYLWSVSITL